MKSRYLGLRVKSSGSSGTGIFRCSSTMRPIPTWSLSFGERSTWAFSAGQMSASPASSSCAVSA